jgi:GNAT superfamily N-acetyltransferase
MQAVSEPVTIRRYRPADQQAVWDLHHTALRGVGAHLGTGPWDDDLRDIERLYLDGTGEFLVGELNGDIVAMGALQRRGVGMAAVRRMRVDPGHQRRGIGGWILETLESRARELGYRRLVLDTTTVQHAAIAFYTAHRYRHSDVGAVGPFTILYFTKVLGTSTARPTQIRAVADDHRPQMSTHAAGPEVSRGTGEICDAHQMRMSVGSPLWIHPFPS